MWGSDDVRMERWGSAQEVGGQTPRYPDDDDDEGMMTMCELFWKLTLEYCESYYLCVWRHVPISFVHDNDADDNDDDSDNDDDNDDDADDNDDDDDSTTAKFSNVFHDFLYNVFVVDERIIK